jgi:hypothetical protein
MELLYRFIGTCQNTVMKAPQITLEFIKSCQGAWIHMEVHQISENMAAGYWWRYKVTRF